MIIKQILTLNNNKNLIRRSFYRFNHEKSLKEKVSFYNSNNSNNSNSKDLPDNKLIIASISAGLSLGIIYLIKKFNSQNIEAIDWQKFKSILIDNPEKVNKIELNNNRKAIIYPEKNFENKFYYLPISDNNYTHEKIEKYNPDIVIQHSHPSYLSNLFFSLIPSLGLLGLFFFVTRKNSGGVLNMFKSDFKIIDEKTNIKLSDLAGLKQTKKDILEFSDIIMNPDKYLKLGTKIPKGVLMEGPPGTGKTMLAKAIADEYNCKFFLINGSDFIQPIIGTGSRKVKDLFDTARKNSPCIIFIDEIDAIGKSRNVSKTVGNDERDNILNSLLVEMDGFEDNQKILILGATNRANILDSALLRPGRFDRVVKFNNPSLIERKEILNLYYDKYLISREINQSQLVDKLANYTYGFNSSQLANLFNEASIRAIRNKKDSIDLKDFEETIDYLLLGNKSSIEINKHEKEIIAYHEAGHALVSCLLENIPNPSKVSIVPREKGSLGFSMSIPKYEKKLYNYEDLVSQLMVIMGGRAAEQLVFNQITNGASDDIKKINELAKEIINTFGMNPNIGLRSIEKDSKNNLWRPESEHLIKMIDHEINSLINNSYERTLELLSQNQDKLISIKKILIDKETITEQDLNLILTK